MMGISCESVPQGTMAQIGRLHSPMVKPSSLYIKEKARKYYKQIN